MSGRPARARATRPAARARSARAQGLRTLQHQSLPVTLCHALESEVWLRTLVAGSRGGVDRRWATKDQVYDEAIAWFLVRYEGQVPSPLPERAGVATEDLTFWLDSALMQRLRRVALRVALKPSRLIELALECYVQRHIPAELLEFRRRVQQEAVQLHEARARPGTRS